MEKIKVIFLDIDGVLRLVTGNSFDKKCVDNINKLVKETGAKIVISSTWRRNGLEAVKEFLEKYEIEGIFDMTPIFNVLKVYPTEDWNNQFKPPRGMEIREWLRNYTNMDRYVESYVIIDDSEDMLLNQLSHYVKVEQTKGFDNKCLKKAIEILKIINIPTI